MRIALQSHVVDIDIAGALDIVFLGPYPDGLLPLNISGDMEDRWEDPEGFELQDFKN